MRAAEPADSVISLGWDDNTEPDLAGYNMYRSLTPGAGHTKLNSSLLTDPEYVDTDVINCITYYYLVTAVDAFRYESDFSGEVAASPGPQPVMRLLGGLGVITNKLNVRKWEDQAKNNNAKQDTPEERPILASSAINGRPAIDFDGTGKHLDVADSKDINTGGPHPAKTLVVVFKTSSDITSRQIIWEQGGGTRGLSFYLDGGNLYINGWNLQDTEPLWGPTGLNTPVSPDTVYAATMILDAAAGTFEGFVNGASIGIADANELYGHSDDCAFGHREGGTKFHDGTNSGSANFAGQIAEFYQYNDALSTEDRLTIEAALMDKYGI